VNDPLKKAIARHKVVSHMGVRALSGNIQRLLPPVQQVRTSGPRWEGENLYIFYSQGRTVTYLF
jgi:hypothetical protein